MLDHGDNLVGLDHRGLKACRDQKVLLEKQEILDLLDHQENK